MSVEGKFLSKEINDLFWREGLTLVTAESCTAGGRYYSRCRKFTLL
jgi:nicotinamide mononucleotide (NMN) deamidase PncC